MVQYRLGHVLDVLLVHLTTKRERESVTALQQYHATNDMMQKNETLVLTLGGGNGKHTTMDISFDQTV